MVALSGIGIANLTYIALLNPSPLDSVVKVFNSLSPFRVQALVFLTGFCPHLFPLCGFLILRLFLSEPFIVSFLPPLATNIMTTLAFAMQSVLAS